jgi:hypothetical protein
MAKRALEHDAPVATLPTLPDDLWTHFLVQYAPRPAHCRAVCRGWRDAIDEADWVPVAKQRHHAWHPSIARIVHFLDRITDRRAQHCRRYIGFLVCARHHLFQRDEPVKRSAPATDQLQLWLESQADNVLSLRNFHPRDFALVFFEEGHRYWLVTRDEVPGGPLMVLKSGVESDDNEDLHKLADPPPTLNFFFDAAAPLISGTGLVGQFFPEFDGPAVARRMFERKAEWEAGEAAGWAGVSRVERRYLEGKREKWMAKYAAITSVEALLAEWERDRTEASTLGTAMHQNNELYYTERAHDKTSREFALLMAFERDHIRGRLRAHRTEWTIYNDPLRLCGSVDILYEYLHPNGRKRDAQGKLHLVLMDWKRSREIVEFNQYEQGCLPPTAHAGDCNYVHYSIQLCLYKWMLEESYDVVIDAMFLVVLHPRQETYLKIEVKWAAEMMDGILEHRRRAVRGAPVARDEEK